LVDEVEVDNKERKGERRGERTIISWWPVSTCTEVDGTAILVVSLYPSDWLQRKEQRSSFPSFISLPSSGPAWKLWLHLLHQITHSTMIHRMELVLSISQTSLFNLPNFPFSLSLNLMSRFTLFIAHLSTG